MANQTCVGTYLTTRLQQLGISHLFSVPGDYTSDFLEIVDDQSSLHRIGNCNELNAGYAADGYARANGLGAVAVTTGVGSFSLLNAIAGSFVENIPVVAIIGTLSNTKLLNEINAAELYHHNVGINDTNRTVYFPVTVSYQKISNPMTAPQQIDAALTACISQKKPVAIEIMEDCYYMPCPDPEGELAPIPGYEPLAVLQQMASETPPNKYASQIVAAVNNSATNFYNILQASKAPILWIGKELAIYDLQEKFETLQGLIKAPFVNTLLGKAVISENSPWYLGLYDSMFTSDYTNQYIQKSDCIIGLGTWNTDLNEFGAVLPDAGDIASIEASRNMVKIAANPALNSQDDLFVGVSLEHLLDAVIGLIEKNGYNPVWQQPTAPPAPQPPAGTDPITYDSFFEILNGSLSNEMFVVADVGLSTFGGSSSLKISRQNGFMAQNIWASIGWSVPTGLGASFTSGTRAMVIVGDGAFKLTCQAISTMVMENCNTVIFVLNNKVYGVEQMLLDPTPYKPNSTTPFEAANVLQEWDYVSLINAFSNNASNARGANVDTVQDFYDVLNNISQNPDSVFLVNINLNERDYPSAWSPFVNPTK